MKKGEISSSDLKELVRHIRAIIEIHLKYFGKNYSSDEIAETFADLYLKMFGKTLDHDVILKIKSEQSVEVQRNTDATKIGAIGTMGYNFSRGFLRALYNIIKNDKPAD